MLSAEQQASDHDREQEHSEANRPALPHLCRDQTGVDQAGLASLEVGDRPGVRAVRVGVVGSGTQGCEGRRKLSGRGDFRQPTQQRLVTQGPRDDLVNLARHPAAHLARCPQVTLGVRRRWQRAVDG